MPTFERRVERGDTVQVVIDREHAELEYMELDGAVGRVTAVFYEAQVRMTEAELTRGGAKINRKVPDRCLRVYAEGE